MTLRYRAVTVDRLFMSYREGDNPELIADDHDAKLVELNEQDEIDLSLPSWYDLAKSYYVRRTSQT